MWQGNELEMSEGGNCSQWLTDPASVHIKLSLELLETGDSWSK